MTQLSKKLEQLIKSSKQILPVKTEQGILVGDVIIESQGPIKHIKKDDKILYENLHLNIAVIKIANLLAQKRAGLACEEIYAADQEYGKWFVDSQILRNQYQKAVSNQQYDRADMFWARYVESRDKTATAKKRVEFLCRT